MKRFDGKVAVVTGGNSGIGLARDRRRRAGLAGGCVPDGGARRGDGQDPRAVQQIDALFVNAGIAKLVPFDQVTETFFDETVAINLKGVFFTVPKALPLLPPGAAVLLNASINAHKGMPGTTVYGATKAAVAPPRLGEEGSQIQCSRGSAWAGARERQETPRSRAGARVGVVG